ncbi:TetR/AcrR family transcriptional regulator C-terminal domain-containing protein [Geodermatophilus sp. TF02-6]|uniref:TetR/AcrR family transcriptional regulator C-terminal domain-containing protein n=1 Tax=Geodermatophilus sp. TF02-6 TaxID=2250575 RepID=UPI00131459D4|nr:TetR/AcrR family transcriptional regulator C-terminal domain-containing protein [Geodermatophilus sp. TF02-6]
MATWLRSYRRALAEHPSLIPLLTEQTMTAGSVLRGYDRVAALLGGAGFPEDQVMLWVSVLDSYALGAAFDLAAPAEVWRVDRGDTPVLDAALRAAPRGRARADAAFQLGLEALLAGMRSRLPGRPD